MALYVWVGLAEWRSLYADWAQMLWVIFPLFSVFLPGPQQWFSTMAAYCNHLGSFKNNNSQGTIFRYIDLIGLEGSLGIGIFFNSQDDSNVQSRLRVTAIESPSGSTLPESTNPVFQGSWLHGVWRGPRCLQSLYMSFCFQSCLYLCLNQYPQAHNF